MTISSGAVTATTTRAQLDTGVSNMVRLIIRNEGSTTAYLGGVDASASNGFPLNAEEAYEWPARLYSSDVYYLTESGSTELRWLLLD